MPRTITPPVLPTTITMTPAATKMYSAQQSKDTVDTLSGAMCSDGIQSNYSRITNVAKFIDDTANLASLDSYAQDASNVLTLQQFALSQLLSVKNINVAVNHFLRTATTSNPLGVPNFQGQINGFLTQLTDLLNTRIQNENPLSGTATNTDAVVNLTTLGPLSSGSSVNTSYYQGNNYTQTLDLDPNNSVTLFQLNATNPAIEKLIRALRIAQSANPNNPTDPSLLNALTLSDEVNTSDMGTAIVMVMNPITLITNYQKTIDPLRSSIMNDLQSSVVDDFYQDLIDFESARANLRISQFLITQEMQDLKEFLKSI